MSTTNPNPPQYRPIRSFVIRSGRMTAKQREARERHWLTYGLNDSAPLDAVQVFSREAPLVLEIGFGMGASLIEMATKESEKNFIGIEVHPPGIGKVMQLAEDAGLNNLKVYQGDAIQILKTVIPNDCLTRLQLYFPDPWPKKRHHKRRIVQRPFVELLRQKLCIGGRFHMATDVLSYAEHMLEVMQEAPGFRNCANSQTGYFPRPSFRPLTKFEVRGEKLGHGVWDIIFERTS